MTAQLSTIAASIRHAVIVGAYADAEALLSKYCLQLEAELHQDSPVGDLLAKERLRTLELFDWVFRMVCAGRSHDAARFAEIPRSGWPARQAANQLHSWQLAG
jgi:hypothetical protein